MIERPAVRHTVDFDRIAGLPRRVLDADTADTWAEVFTDALIAPGAREAAKRAGRPPPAARRWQGQCCAEGIECRGGFWVLPVGLGKTWLTRYIGELIASLRTLVIVPANLRNKTQADFRAYINVWRTPTAPLVIMSREELALEKNANFLETFQPTAIVIDEADEFANFDASAPARLDRYIMARTREQCAVFCLSGTPTRNSIMAYWHLLRWTHRDDAPVPRLRSEARMWAAALDQQKTAADSGRVDPGPLGETRKAALRWYRDRLQQTPGVIIIDGDSATKADGSPIPLTLRTRLPRECPAIDAAFAKFALEQQNPDGVTVADPLGRWRLENFLGCGGFPRYKKPGPPKEWRELRALRGRAYAALCREVISSTRSKGRDPLDTERQVRKRFAGHPVITEWDEVADDPYAKEFVWISDATIQTAVDWLAESTQAGIVWCGGVEFARELSRVTRLQYYARDGKDQNKNELHAAKPGRSFICSWNANKKGFNLQAWTRHAVFTPPSSAKWLEQLFGRSHRAGVAETGVTYDLFATSGGTLDTLDCSIAEAGFAKESVGPTQKILRSKIDRSQSRPRKTDQNRWRWARK